MSYGRILGTAIPRSSVYMDYPQQLVSEPYGLAMAVTSLYGRSYGGFGGIGIMMIMVAYYGLVMEMHLEGGFELGRV